MKKGIIISALLTIFVSVNCQFTLLHGIDFKYKEYLFCDPSEYENVWEHAKYIDDTTTTLVVYRYNEDVDLSYQTFNGIFKTEYFFDDNKNIQVIKHYSYHTVYNEFLLKSEIYKEYDDNGTLIWEDYSVYKPISNENEKNVIRKYDNNGNLIQRITTTLHDRVPIETDTSGYEYIYNNNRIINQRGLSDGTTSYITTNLEYFTDNSITTGYDEIKVYNQLSNNEMIEDTTYREGRINEENNEFTLSIYRKGNNGEKVCVANNITSFSDTDTIKIKNEYYENIPEIDYVVLHNEDMEDESYPRVKALNDSETQFIIKENELETENYNERYLIQHSHYSVEDSFKVDAYNVIKTHFFHTYNEKGAWVSSKKEYSFQFIEIENDSTSIKEKYTTIYTQEIPEVLLNYQNSLGINESAKNNFQVYPNPASAVLNVEINPDSQFTEINLLNTSGTIVLEHAIQNESKISLNIEDLPKGIYVIQLTGDKKTATKRIVVF